MQGQCQVRAGRPQGVAQGMGSHRKVLRVESGCSGQHAEALAQQLQGQAVAQIATRGDVAQHGALAQLSVIDQAEALVGQGSSWSRRDGDACSRASSASSSTTTRNQLLSVLAHARSDRIRDCAWRPRHVRPAGRVLPRLRAGPPAVGASRWQRSAAVSSTRRTRGGNSIAPRFAGHHLGNLQLRHQCPKVSGDHGHGKPSAKPAPAVAGGSGPGTGRPRRGEAAPDFGRLICKSSSSSHPRARATAGDPRSRCGKPVCGPRTSRSATPASGAAHSA